MIVDDAGGDSAVEERMEQLNGPCRSIPRGGGGQSSHALKRGREISQKRKKEDEI